MNVRLRSLRLTLCVFFIPFFSWLYTFRLNTCRKLWLPEAAVRLRATLLNYQHILKSAAVCGAITTKLTGTPQFKVRSSTQPSGHCQSFSKIGPLPLRRLPKDQRQHPQHEPLYVE